MTRYFYKAFLYFDISVTYLANIIPNKQHQFILFQHDTQKT